MINISITFLQIILEKSDSFRMIPITREDAEEMVNELEINPLFNGYRGIKIDKQKLIDAIFRIARISYCKNLSS